MEQTRKIFAASAFGAPPMLYRSPADALWTRFRVHDTDRSDLLYNMDSLVPVTYGSFNLKVLASALEYAVVMSGLHADGRLSGLLSAQSPSTWTYVLDDAKESVCTLRANSLQEEFYIAAYNAAAACMQAAMQFHSVKTSAGSVEKALRLTLVAQNTLRCLHEIREESDPLVSGLVSVSGPDGSQDVAPPAAASYFALDVLTTFAHAQLAEFQIRFNREVAEEVVPASAFHYAGDVYDACNTALQDPALAGSMRLSVVPRKLRRLTACKRHLAKAIALDCMIATPDSDRSAAAAATLGQRHLENAVKSLNKTKSKFPDVANVIAELKDDPLFSARLNVMREIEILQQDFADTIDGMAASTISEVEVSTQDAKVRSEEHGIKYMLSQPPEWPASNFPALLSQYALGCRGQMLGSADRLTEDEELSLLIASLSGFEEAPEDETAVEAPVVEPTVRLKRLFALHKAVVSRHAGSHTEVSDGDEAIRLNAWKMSLIHVCALTKAVFFTEFTIDIAEILLVGRLMHEGREEEAHKCLSKLPVRSEASIARHIEVLDDAQSRLRLMLKEGERHS